MENATKALLIAAAVLIAIVIIAMGIRLVASARGSVDQAEDLSSSMEISMVNSQFETYEGTNIDVSRVKSLARKVLTYNNRNENKKITIKRKNDTNGISSSPKINEWIDTLNQHSNWEYKISVAEYYNDGTIKKINATLTSGSGNEGTE